MSRESAGGAGDPTQDKTSREMDGSTAAGTGRPETVPPETVPPETVPPETLTVHGLNTAQREAVECIEGPLLILAGPGSGKTRVITHRIARILQSGVPGYHVLALTFTNKAADEMRQRVDAIVPDNGVWIGTFHRFCAKLLRRHAQVIGLEPNYTILDVADSQRILKNAIQEDELGTGKFSMGVIASAISTAKSQGVHHDEFQALPGSPLGEVVSRIYPLYQRHLLRANAVDFDDLLTHVATIFRTCEDIRSDYDSRYRYVMVDEYQDTNIVQYGIVRMISGNYPNLAVTGDPDQSIYGWRGATIRNILDFEKDYADTKVIRLEENYRSTPEILYVADSVIRNNRQRKHKELIPVRPSGESPRVIHRFSQAEEGDTIAAEIAGHLASGKYTGKDIAIFYRANWLSRSMEKSLRQFGIPYQVVRGVSFFQRKEIKDLLAYLQLLHNPKNDAALLRIINTPTRGIGDKTQGRILALAQANGCSMFEAARLPELAELLGAKARRDVAKFVGLVDSLSVLVDAPLEELLGQVVSATKYDEYAKANSSGQDSGEEDRLSNVAELLNDAREFDERHGDTNALELYLEQVSLVNDVDGWDEAEPRVTLMTMHASKGLEFPAVYMIGLEDGIIPHQRSKDEGNIEEERRLFFVGLTRAMDELTISHVERRSRGGGLQFAIPSPFLFELPRDGVHADRKLADRRDPYASQDPGFDLEDFEEPAIQYEATSAHPSPVANPSPSAKAPRDASPQHDSSKDRQAQPSSRSLPLTTAASMLSPDEKSGDATSETRPDPELFQFGMVVEHPSYGLGKITSLSGAGQKRRATVQFFSGQSSHFLIAFSPLRLVSSE